MADPMPQKGSSQEIYAAVLADMDRRLRELEAPSGTQRSQTMGDVLGRTLTTLTPSGMTAPAAPSGQPFVWVTKQLVFPRPLGGARSGLFLIKATPAAAAGSSASAYMQVVDKDSNVLVAASGGGGGAGPPGWAPLVSGFAPIAAAAGEDFTVTIRLTGEAFVGSGNVSLSNITAALLYGERI